MTFTKKGLIEMKKEGNNLEKHVISILLDKGSKEDIQTYIKDLMYGGCQSGMEGSLIYYTDTLEFYNKFKNEINSKLYNNLAETGCSSPSDLFGNKWDKEDPLAIDTTNQNLLAWFGYEETVRDIAYKMGMEV